MSMRRRTHEVRRFLLGLLLAYAPLAPTFAWSACPTVPASPETGVRRVIDGDTLVLADGRHVRFIGINAMELGYDGGQDQPYAAAARNRLKQLIAAGDGKLRLGLGDEPYDQHGRTLADLFPGGQDLGLELIREGLAVLVAVPPNLAQLSCYQDAEAEARNHHSGVWSQASPLVTDAAHADMRLGAFVIVHDVVMGVVRSPAGLKLILGGRLPLWISNPDLGQFSANLAEFKGHPVLVRGWLQEYRGRPELDVHAPGALLTQGLGPWPASGGGI